MHGLIVFHLPCSLWSNNIGDEGAKAIAEALKTNSTLTTLEWAIWIIVCVCHAWGNMVNCWVAMDAWIDCCSYTMQSWLQPHWRWRSKGDCRGIEDQQYTHFIEVSNMNDCVVCVMHEVVCVIVEWLWMHGLTVAHIPCSLYENKIGDEGAKAIAEALKTNSTLTALK